MRRASKVDSNHGTIVAVLRRAGASVLSLARVGDDAPDLLIGFAGVNLLAEVKPVGKKLRPSQADWHRDWRGQVCVLRTAEDAIELLRGLYPRA